MNNEDKDLIAATLSLEQMLDLLDLTEIDIVELLDEEQRQKLLRTIRDEEI